jgi:hypothetical protein
MKSRTLSRRSVLTGLAGTSIALPWLEAMLPIKSAQGQAAKPPLRFVAFITTDGVFPQRFWPRLPGEAMYPLDKTPTPGFYSGCAQGGCASVPGADSTDFIFAPGLEPLARHRDDLLIIEGLDASGGPGHDQWPSILTGRTGRNTGISLDQAIANQIAGDTKFKSLNLGVRTDNGIPFSCYDVDQPALQENDPQAVFDRVFAEVAPPDPGVVDRARAERKSVLDSALADISDLQKRVGQADREKLQNYFDSIREVEARLDKAGGGVSCGRPMLETGQGEWWKSDDNIPQVMNAQFDMLAMAFACDLTRVATLSFGNNNCDVTLPAIGVKTGFHTLGHEPDSNFAAWNDVAKIDVWNAEQLAGFIDRLKAIPEGDGTVFDNTVVVWLNEMTRGDHDTGNIPHIMAGSAQGYFKTGRYIRLPRSGEKFHNYPKGRWSNDFKVSVLQSMGVAATTFGDPAQCEGPLDILRG